MESIPNVTIFPKPKPSVNQTKAITQVEIGGTTYDLQSNASVQNRTSLYSDGTIGATFTRGELNPNFDDRGTGYNYEDGTNWGPLPNSRIETSRHGWPSLMLTANGTEAVISHSGTGNFTVNTRNPKGVGTWTESTIPTSTGHSFFWPRAVAGGPDGNTIHCIGITVPVGNGGTPYMGIDGALLYFRSLDAGVTWDIIDYLNPDLDSTKFNHTRADSYSIISEGNDVAIAVYNQWADMILLKSSDNGTSWNSQIVNDFPIDLFVADQGSDWNNDQIFDTITTCDEAGSILFDENNMVHMTFGRMRVLDADTTDGNTSYFPGTQELLYWNENMGTGNFMTIGAPEDVDGSGTLEWAGAWALYYTSLASHPSMGLGENGTIYVAFDCYREDIIYIDQNARNIYVTKTNDGGASWTTPYNVTPDPILYGYECVFPAMAPIVEGKVLLTYQRDFEPGLATRGDMDAYAYNEIMFLCADTALVDDAGLSELSNMGMQLELAPNPSNTQTTLNITLEESQEATITITALNGQLLITAYSGMLNAGLNTIQLETATLNTGIYLVTTTIGEQREINELVVSH